MTATSFCHLEIGIEVSSNNKANEIFPRKGEKWKMRLFKFLSGIVLALLLLISPFTAGAHDEAYSDSLALGDFSHFVDHDDSDPFKGWLELTVTNTGLEAWGDFHFEISQAPTGPDAINVVFDVTSPYEPISSQAGFTWDISSDLKTLDFYFYSNPVACGESATFSVYTDNPDQISFFRTCYYPTPVPIPGAALLYVTGCGLFGWIAGRKHFGKSLKG